MNPPAHEHGANRARGWRALTAALVLLALARLFAIVAHDPLAGYANQYDMVRTAACIGLWPAGDPAQRAQATPEAPRARQVIDAPEPEGCYPSTDVALAWAGVAVARALDAVGFDGEPGIDLRAIGATKAALFALLLLAATRALRAHPRVACAHAAFVAFVVCDPLNTLYLNTLYTETGALLGAWLAVLGLLMRTLPRTDHRLAFAAVLLGAALLGASRVQHLALPFGFALLWWITARANRASTPAAPSTLAREESLPLDGRGGESRRMRRPAERPREERGPDGGAGERVPTPPQPTDRPREARGPDGGAGEKVSTSPQSTDRPHEQRGQERGAGVAATTAPQSSSALAKSDALTNPSPRAAGRGAGVRGKLAQTFALVLIAIAAVTLQLTTQSRFESIAGANRQNMLFGALLPAAADPTHLATRLGLPPHCADLAYASWYRQLGRDIASACPEATRPSLARIAWVVATEPATALTLAGRSLAQSTAWRMPYVGEIAGGDFERLGPGPLGLSFSLADAAATSSLAAHALFWLLPLLAAFGASWRLLRAQPRPATQIALDTGLAACAGIVATVWATSILGDGYSELARHLHLAVSAVCAGWLLLGLALWHARPRAALESVATLAIALAIIAAGARAPLAVGRVDPPETDAMLAGQVPLAGWVLAPRGATAVELREAGSVVARFDVQPSPKVAALFPVADGSTAWRFEGTLDAGAPRPRTLELFVIASDGSAQRIDRRRFDLVQ